MVWCGCAGECTGDRAEVGGSEGETLETAHEEIEGVMAAARPHSRTGMYIPSPPPHSLSFHPLSLSLPSLSLSLFLSPPSLSLSLSHSSSPSVQVWGVDLQKNEMVVKDVILVAQGEMALEEFLKQVHTYVGSAL